MTQQAMKAHKFKSQTKPANRHAYESVTEPSAGSQQPHGVGKSRKPSEGDFKPLQSVAMTAADYALF